MPFNSGTEFEYFVNIQNFQINRPRRRRSVLSRLPKTTIRPAGTGTTKRGTSLLVPAAGRRAVQRSARSADSPEVTIHNDGTYTVRPNQKGKGKPAHGPNRTAAPAGRQPSPGASRRRMFR